MLQGLADSQRSLWNSDPEFYVTLGLITEKLSTALVAPAILDTPSNSVFYVPDVAQGQRLLAGCG